MQELKQLLVPGTATQWKKLKSRAEPRRRLWKSSITVTAGRVKKIKNKKSCIEAGKLKSPGVGLQTGGDIFSPSFCLVAPGSATDPPGHPAATHFLSSLPWKTPADSTALSHLLAKSFFGEEFCPVAKSQREKEREQQNNDAFTPTAFALNPSQK